MWSGGEAAANKQFGAYLSQKGQLCWKQYFCKFCRKNTCKLLLFAAQNN